MAVLDYGKVNPGASVRQNVRGGGPRSVRHSGCTAFAGTPLPLRCDFAVTSPAFRCLSVKKRTKNGPRTEAERTLNGERTDNERRTNGQRTDNERTLIYVLYVDGNVDFVDFPQIVIEKGATERGFQR